MKQSNNQTQAMAARNHFKNKAGRGYIFLIGSLLVISITFSSCAAMRRTAVQVPPTPTPVDWSNITHMPHPGERVVVWGETPEEMVWNGFMSTGLFTPAQTAALIGNVIGESLSPTQNEIRRPVGDGTWRYAEFGEGGIGISQWTNSPGGTFFVPGGGGRRDNFVDAFKAAGFARFHNVRYSLPIDRLREIVTDEELSAMYAFQISFLLNELSRRTPRGTTCAFNIDTFPEGASELEVIQQMDDVALITSFIQHSFLRPAVTIPGHVLHTLEMYQITLNRRTEAAMRVYNMFGGN